MINDYEIEKLVENYLFDEVERCIEDGLLENYESFKYNFAKIKPTKELYERLKEGDKWALYDYVGDYNEYYPDWRNILIKALKKYIEINSKEIDAKIDFLESSEMSDASSNIACGIIEKAIKGERKKIKNEK